MAAVEDVDRGGEGGSFYRQEAAVTDGNLITVSGIVPLEFAKEVIRNLDVFSAQTLKAWYQLSVTHEMQYFHAIMESLEE
ncbi:hypothetical protein [Methanococcoides sp. LMO-2]|uniref:Uncharacterized protein n=1 Tax=Methanococcoides cohabitans TaxID=3136559 RepID=A0ABU9KQE7_9EURY